MKSSAINLRLSSVVALWLAMCGHARVGAAEPAPAGVVPAKPRPNILFVAIDDLNDWGVTALSGRQGVHTPNLDRLAAQGMLFLNANCAAPACNPSRTAILTGVAPHSSGVYNNSCDWRVNERLKPVTTLPNYFRQHGYTAYGAGKLFHSLEWHDGPTDGYNDPGSWDTYFPSFQRQMPHRVLPPDRPLARGTGTRPPDFFDWGPIQQPMESMPDHQVIDWSIAELGKKHEKPFFQAVGIFRPHIPWYVPKQFFDLYPLDQIQLPYVRPGWREKLPPAAQQSGQARRQWHQWILDNHEWTKAVQGYLASISFADYQLGRLLDALDRSPEKDNTIVMLWTDHGFHVGDKTTWEKFTLWAESTRVPFIVVVPGMTRPGSQCARAVSLLDMYPTLVELAGLPPCAKNQGMSLVPWLRDPARPKEQPAVITNGRGNHAVRDDRWHYIRYANGDEELYDMSDDDSQWDNLAADPEHADVKARLAQWLPKEDAPDQGPTPGGLEGPPLKQGAGLRMGGDGATPAGTVATQAKPAAYPIQAAPMTAVRFAPDNFWSPRLATTNGRWHETGH
jgi:arylsulfatase A-like enzyme